jgi:hypothetical protein
MSPALSKAKRVKRRWLGCHVSAKLSKRDEVEAAIAECAVSEGWRLFDFIAQPEPARAIIRVPLSDQADWRAALEQSDLFEPVTTSGKIRLVRERMGISAPRRPRRR